MAIKFLASGQVKASNLQNKQVKKIFQKKVCQVLFCLVLLFILGVFVVLFLVWLFSLFWGLLGCLFVAVHFFPSQAGRLLTWLLSVKAVQFATHSDSVVSSNKSSRQRAAALKSQSKPFQ